jgi:RNA recognition motif-containing protein
MGQRFNQSIAGDTEINRTLLISNISRGTEASEIHYIFGKQQGFLEIRQVKERGIAFVEFENAQAAGNARSNLGNVLSDKGWVIKSA